MKKWLAGILSSIMGWAAERVGKYLLGAGAFGAAYVGANALIDKVVRGIAGDIGGGVDGAFQVLMMAGVGVALNILLSACAFSLAAGVAKGAAK